jgi:hypothetical protein
MIVKSTFISLSLLIILNNLKRLNNKIREHILDFMSQNAIT